MYISNKIGIIADDLTGANDTALQFFIRGCNTQILLDYHDLSAPQALTQAWAIPTESRNVSADEAVEKVQAATDVFLQHMNVEYFYKKIDSTLRGNIAKETLAMLNKLEWDAAVVMPAFPVEGRITVGGYHMLKGVPIQRTELACDPHSPIYESHIPSMLKHQLDSEQANLVGMVNLDTVMKGAGPILMTMNELIKEGKKLIVVDAVSTIDIDQAVLAINKSNYKILPCGSAGLAQSLANLWLADMPKRNTVNTTLPKIPKLIISGSATQLTASQIRKVDDDIDVDNVIIIPVTAEDILKNNTSTIIEHALPNLVKNNTVIIHSSDIIVDKAEFSRYLFDNEISESEFVSKIVDFLAAVTKEIVGQKEVILITIGGETSFKCAKAIDSQHLQVVDNVTSAIPLCLDHKAQLLVTKSGNLGNLGTLIEILNYFEQHD